MRKVWKRQKAEKLKMDQRHNSSFRKVFSKQTGTELQTHHSQKSSESTVPMKPFTSSNVHTLLEGTSNSSMPVRSQIISRGRSSTASNRPTNPAEDREKGSLLKCHIDSFKNMSEQVAGEYVTPKEFHTLSKLIEPY